MQTYDLIASLTELLQPQSFKDYAPNGLQIEGKKEVHHILTAVTASQAAIDAAVALGADALLVHHGYFWQNEASPIIGIKYQRIKTLINHEINLIAYHLPLDGHVILGNNAQLAKKMKWLTNPPASAQNLLWQGHLSEAKTAQALADDLMFGLQHPPLLLGNPQKTIKTLAWCTGGAQSYFEAAANLGVDAFITGEVSEKHFHLAHEMDCIFIAAGHHATERYGVQALGDWLHDTHSLKISFFDEANPV
ncbi:MAG: Nif3-like dinuclear metal center hexameric protein [Neisseriaceae bacterium]|nr:Nif3-like dinuclear metal center hexameric protein [Neisseriaceae bacterium]